MARTSWLLRLLKASQSPKTITHKRRAFSPIRTEFLEDRTAPATLDWTGSAGANWNNSANWTPSGVPSATNNVLNFNAATATNFTSTNDIPGLTGMTINITDANAAAGKDFTITGINAGITSLSNNKTDSQATATNVQLAMTGAGATLTATAGTLSILNTSNVFDAASTVNVPTGATLTVAVFPSSSLGSAKYNLTGGALNVGPSGTFFTNAFNVGQNNVANDLGASSVPLPSLGTDVQLYPIMADVSRTVPAADTQFQTNTHTWGNNDTYFYSGEIFFPNSNGDGTGSIAFAEQNDDSTYLAIDGTVYISDATYNVTNTSLDPNTGGQPVTLPTGWHRIDLRFGNGGGGAGPANANNNWSNGNGNAAATSNPSGKGFGYRVTDSAGSEVSAAPLDARSYRRLYAAPTVYGINAITESGTTVTVTTAAPSTTTPFNSSVKVGDKVKIAGVTPAAYNGDWTVATVTGNTFTFAHPTSGLAAGTVNNLTTLTLPDDGTRLVRYGISAMTESGTTVTVTTAAPGTTTAMPSGAQIGDKIVITGATPAAYNGTWTVTDVPAANTFTFEHTQSGLAALTASAASTAVGLPDDKVRVRVPSVSIGAVSNAVSVSGNSTINLDSTLASATMGNLTMASGATLNVVAGNAAGQTLGFGTTALAGDVTFSTSAGATLNLAGAVSQTAAAGITKTGAGSLTLGAANTYSGPTTISAGSVTAAVNGALGTSTGAADGTTVASGGQLVIGASYTNLEVLSLAGTGTTATNGALTSAATATYAGPITLTGNAWITSSANTLTLSGGITAGANQLTLGGAGTVTVSTAGITGSGKIVKTDAGTARLNVANPNLTGDISLLAGTLRVSVDGALGTVAGATTVSSGATLRFDTLTTYTALEPLNIAGAGAGGVGAIQSQTNNVTLNSPITLLSNATIGSGTAGFKLTLNGAITLPTVSDLSFTGAGNIDVVQAFGNGNAVVQSNKALYAQYQYDSSGNRTTTDLDSLALLNSTTWLGSGFVKGPMNFFEPADPSVAAAGGVFAPLFGLDTMASAPIVIYFSGQMNVTSAGNYSFATGNVANLTGQSPLEAAGRVWLDVNKDHIFDPSEELLDPTNGPAVSPAIPLAAGSYDILIPYTNGGGSGQVNVSYSANGGTTYQLIDPSAGTVANTNFTNSKTFQLGPNNKVNMNGTGIVTLLGANTYNGTTTVNSGTLVVGAAGALGSTPAVNVKSGGTLALGGGVTVNVPVSASGAGAGGVGAINNLTGTNTIAGPLTIAGSTPTTAANTTIGSASGTLNVNGPITLGLIADVTFTGAGNINVAQSFGNGSAPLSFNALYAQYQYDSSGNRTASDMDSLALLGSSSWLGSALVKGPLNIFEPADPSVAATGGQFAPLFGLATMASQPLVIYFSGQMHVTTAGDYSFGTGNIANLTGQSPLEAAGRVWLDLNKDHIFTPDEELLNPTAGPPSSSPVTLAPGVYDIVIPYTNGGGSGQVNVSYSSDGGTTYRIINPTDPAQAGVWTTSLTPANNVFKNGTGTVTFMASNTYNGNTTVNAGTLATTANNALGTGPASTLTVSGATTALNLFNSATAVTTVGSASFIAGTVNTGALGGVLAVKTQLKLPGDYTVTGNMTAQGANLADNSAPRTLTAVSGTLDVTHLLATTISRTTKADTTTDNGQLFFLNGPATYSAAQMTQTNPYTTAPDAQLLIVSVDSRQSGTNANPTVSFGGTPLTPAATALGLVSNFFNSGIWYLYLSPADVGVTKNLVVTWPSTATLNDSHSIYAQTLKGMNVGAAPLIGTATNPEITANSQTVTVNNVPGGSWGVSTFGYRTGTTPVSLSVTTSNGTLVTGGTINAPAGTTSNGVYWTSQTTNVVSTGGLVSNLSSGTVTFTNTATQTNGSNHWNGAAAVFTPKLTPAAVNLPATTIALPAGTTLSVNGPGDNVLGNISYSGNATIIAGAIPPASLTIGGVSGAGTGTLAINNNLGLKLAASSTYSVDINGASAGTQYDQDNVNGAVNLTGVTLSVTAGFTPAVGTTFTIISNDGTDPVVGTFTGLAQGATVTAGAAAFTISYTGGDGNDVVLTATTPGATTTTTLVATPLATTGGSSVQFTATVAPSPAALGTVTFLDNGAPITGGANIAVANGVAIFSTTTLAVGSHPVTAAYSGAAGFAPSTSNVQTVVVSAGGTAPAVNTITFNGGLTGFSAAQHSRIINVAAEFNQPVILDNGAMTLALHTNNVNYAGNTGGTGQPNGAGVPATLTATASTDSKTWTLTWSGANTEVGADQLASLKDGVYDLVIDATKVHPVGSPTVNMTANSTTVFHRLFGDTNAPAASGNDFTAILAGNDNLAFRGAFNKPAGGGYVPFLDFNGDGNINSADNLAFRGRFNKNLTWTV